MISVDRKCPECGEMMGWTSSKIWHCSHCDKYYKLSKKEWLMEEAGWILYVLIYAIVHYVCKGIFENDYVRLTIQLIADLIVICVFQKYRYRIFDGRELKEVEKSKE